MVRIVVGAAAVLAALASPAAAVWADTVLGVSDDGRRFTINAEPTFLLGASYYAATSIEEPEFWRSDLARLREHGFNWVRIWATWHIDERNVSAIDGQGNPAEPYWTRLVDIIAYCDEIGMVVDVTLDRTQLEDFEAHLQAVRTLARELRNYRNVYIDVGNERNIGDARFVPLEEAAELVAAIKEIDPERLCTASGGADEPERESVQPLADAGFDMICPHRRRAPGSPEETEEHARRLAETIAACGRVVPIHYQEPFRRDYSRDWQPAADEFLTDLAGAVRGGAAGWCFHNGSNRNRDDGQPRRSFDMGERSLFEQLDAEELAVVERAAEVVSGEG